MGAAITEGPRSGDMSGDWEFLLPAEARGKIACRSVTILSAYANFETMGRNWPVIVRAVSSLITHLFGQAQSPMRE